MARTATIYRMKVELSDVDRGVYETLDFRVVQHPSEVDDRLVARILAYLHHYEEGLEFGRGLSDVDEAALWTHDLTGRLHHWIDVGVPTAERIHLASKKAERVTIVCHKPEDALIREMEGRRVHDAQNVAVLYLDPDFVQRLAGGLERTAAWVVVRTDGELSVTIGDETFPGAART